MTQSITELAQQKQTRTILWIVGGTAAAVAFFYSQIAIPIQDIRAQLAQVNFQLADSAKKYDAIITEQKRQADDIIVLKQKIK